MAPLNKPAGDPSSRQPPTVVFRARQVQDDGSTYEIYAAVSREAALAFLRARIVKQERYYVVVTFPGGSLGKDFVVIYDEKTQDVLEFGTRLRLPTPTPSLTRCAGCDHPVLPASPAPGERVVALLSFTDLKRNGHGFDCRACQTLWCAFCAAIHDGRPFCGICRQAMMAHEEPMAPTSAFCVVLEPEWSAAPPELAAPVAAMDDTASRSWELARDPALATRALALFEEIRANSAWARSPVGFRLATLNVAALALFHRNRVQHRADDLVRAASLWEQALELTAAGSPLGLPLLLNIANARKTLYDLSRRTEDLRAGILALGESIALLPAGTPSLGGLLYNHADWLKDLYDVAGAAEHLEAAIVAAQRGLALARPDSDERRLLMNALGYCLRHRYYHSHDRRDLDHAVQTLQEVVDAVRDDPAGQAPFLSNLGNALRDRYAYEGGALEDLTAAVACFEQAAACGSSAQLPALVINLATGLLAQYRHTGLEGHLRAAIAALDRVGTALLPASFHNIRGFCLHARYDRHGDLGDLRAAIEAFRTAVDQTAAAAVDRPAYLTNLGNGLLELYKRTHVLEDLDAAIAAFEGARDQTPPTSPELAAPLNDLGIAFLHRHARTRTVADLQAAISVLEEAVQRTPDGSPDRPGHLMNLGSTLFERYLRSGDPADLEASIRMDQQALDLTAPRSPLRAQLLNNLGRGFEVRHGRTGSDEDLERGRQAYREACDIALDASLATALESGRNWGDWALGRREWEEASLAYGYGTRAAERLVQAQILLEAKQSWLRDAQVLPGRAAYALARAGDRSGAVRTLEHGRARVMADALERGRIDLERLPALGHADAYERYRAAVGRMAQLEHTSLREASPGPALDPVGALRAARAELDAAVAAIQQIPDYGDFFRPVDLRAIEECVAVPATGDEGPVALVYLVVTPEGGVALILHRGGVESEWLDIRDSDLDAVLIGRRGRPDGYLNAQLGRASMRAALDDVLPWAGGQVMQRVATALTRLGLTPRDGANAPIPRVILIPTGRLALLPLHAAIVDGADGEGPCPFLERFAVAYAPSGRVLRGCQATAAARSDRPPTLLSVGNPLPLPPGIAPLTFSRVEAEEVATFFAGHATLLCETNADRKAIDAGMADAAYLHFACHGEFRVAAPLGSGLVLSGGERLTLGDLYARRRLDGARLAVLSACQTAIADFNDLPEEAVGLAGGILQAGAPAVVGSLWAVNDVSTALLMIKFYGLIRTEDTTAGRHALPPILALREAQRWLRRATRDELSDLFHHYRQTAPDRPRMSYALAQEKFAAYTLHAQSHPFEHAYHWAAFAFFGA